MVDLRVAHIRERTCTQRQVRGALCEDRTSKQSVARSMQHAERPWPSSHEPHCMMCHQSLVDATVAKAKLRKTRHDGDGIHMDRARLAKPRTGHSIGRRC